LDIRLPFQNTLASYEHKWNSYEHCLNDVRWVIGTGEDGVS